VLEAGEHNARSKATLIDMALAWRRLADQAESFRSQAYAHLALILERTLI